MGQAHGLALGVQGTDIRLHEGQALDKRPLAADILSDGELPARQRTTRRAAAPCPSFSELPARQRKFVTPYALRRGSSELPARQRTNLRISPVSL